MGRILLMKERVLHSRKIYNYFICMGKTNEGTKFWLIKNLCLYQVHAHAMMKGTFTLEKISNYVAWLGDVYEAT